MDRLPRHPVPEYELEACLRERLKTTALTLGEQARRAFEYQCKVEECEDCDKCGEKAQDAVSYLIRSLPEIQGILQRDIVAAYEGDPAAKSTMGVVMSYPGVYAIVDHRIAHILYEKNVPLIPRIMSEHTHSVPPNSKVYNQQPKPLVRQTNHELSAEHTRL